MPTIQVSLPEALREFVEAEVRAGSYSGVSEYLSRLIHEEWKNREKARIEQAVLAGLSSGEPREMTSELWRELRDEIATSQR